MVSDPGSPADEARVSGGGPGVDTGLSEEPEVRHRATASDSAQRAGQA